MKRGAAEMEKKRLRIIGCDRPEAKEALAAVLAACGADAVFIEERALSSEALFGGRLVCFVRGADEMGDIVPIAEAHGNSGAALLRLDEKTFCACFFGGEETGSAMLSCGAAAIPAGDAAAILWDAAAILYAGGLYETLARAADAARRGMKIFK